MTRPMAGVNPWRPRQKAEREEFSALQCVMLGVSIGHERRQSSTFHDQTYCQQLRK